MIGRLRVAPSGRRRQRGADLHGREPGHVQQQRGHRDHLARPIGSASGGRRPSTRRALGKRGTALHTNTMHVLRPTKHPREAWERSKHLTSHEVGVQKILMESGSPGGRPDVWNDPRLHAYEPWYKVGASLMPEARPSYVAYNLRTSEVITMEGGLADIWNAWPRPRGPTRSTRPCRRSSTSPVESPSPSSPGRGMCMLGCTAGASAVSPVMRVLLPSMPPDRLAQRRRRRPPCSYTSTPTRRRPGDGAQGPVEGYYGTPTPELLRARRDCAGCRWPAPVEQYLFLELVASEVILTNAKVIYGSTWPTT